MADNEIISHREKALSAAARILAEACAEILHEQPAQRKAYTAEERGRLAADIFTYAARPTDMVEVHMLIGAMQRRNDSPSAQATREAVAALAYVRARLERQP